MPITDSSPPWYYRFYFGTFWSFVVLALILTGFLVFFISKRRKNKSRSMVLLGWAGLAVALFFLSGYVIYYLYLIFF